MSEPLVSVLIPCYNAERWIGETVESVFRQTWKNIEIVVVNDGSTDRSESVLRAMSRPNMFIVTQENRGPSAAMNTALAHAKGEFIQYLDADDVLGPDKIGLQMRRLAGARDCVATAEWARFYKSTGDAKFQPDENWRDMDPADWLVSAWRDGGGMLFPAQWLIPRSIVERAGPWREDLRLNNDGEYFTRIVLAASRVLFCAGARAYYRSGLPGSVSGTKSHAGWVSQQKVLEACESHLLGRENTERTRRAVSLLWQRFAHACYPYDRSIALDAERRASGLHPVRVTPGGGAALRLIMRLIGWKAARVLQLKYYRMRYGRE